MSDTATQGEAGTDQGEGETQTSGTENTTDQGTETGRAGGEDQLKADLAAERKARQAAASQAKALQKQLDSLTAANKSETERAIDKAREEGAQEALSKANVRLVKMAIRSEAKDKLADPTDADVLDPSMFEVDENGDVDTKAIKGELDRLLKEKPHWAKKDSKPGSVNQGARGSAAKATDMNSWIHQAMGHG